MRISDWSSDVCSSDLLIEARVDELRRQLVLKSLYLGLKGLRGFLLLHLPLNLLHLRGEVFPCLALGSDLAVLGRLTGAPFLFGIDPLLDRKSTRLNSSH